MTHSVAILARWMAADLYLREVDALRFELSQNHASDEVHTLLTQSLCIELFLPHTWYCQSWWKPSKSIICATDSRIGRFFSPILSWSQSLSFSPSCWDSPMPGLTEMVSCAGMEAGKRNHQSAACTGRQPHSTGPWAGMCSTLTPGTILLDPWKKI